MGMADGKIYLAANNDLVTDKRVHRTAVTLMESGMQLIIVGRKHYSGPVIEERPYKVLRIRVFFRKSFLMYACFNVRLFCFLLFRKMQILVSTDLDTLPACYLASRLKGVSLVFDSHEFFSELPELIGRRFVRGVWRGLEKRLLPRVKYSYTVCDSIAAEYRKRYGVDMAVVRNLPISHDSAARRPDLLDRDPQRIIIYQGALNMGRGLEGMIRAMEHLGNFEFRIFGTGPMEKKLRSLVQDLNLEDRVSIMGRIPFSELSAHTRQASLGISMEEDLGLNYYYSLPNKLFDYIHAQVPVLVSNLPEMKAVVEKYGVGEVVISKEPEALAKQIRRMMTDHELRILWKKNLRKAAGELCWEKEAGRLREVYMNAGLTFPDSLH